MEQKIFTNRSGNQELRCLQFTNIIKSQAIESIDIIYKILHYWLWHYAERIKVFHKPQIQIWGIYLQVRVFTLCCCLLCKCLKYPSLHASDLLISQDTVHIILGDDISDDDDDDVGVPGRHLGHWTQGHFWPGLQLSAAAANWGGHKLTIYSAVL